MAITIKEKELVLVQSNPNGTEEELNTSTRFYIAYNTNKKQYRLRLSPCKLTPYGFQEDLMACVGLSAELVNVGRRNAKVQRSCEDWMQENIEALNTAFVYNGMNGVREVILDTFNIA